MLSVFARSLRDLLDIRILLISLVPITLAALIWGVIIYVFAGQIDEFLISWLERIPFMDNEWAIGAIEVVGGVLIYYQLLIATSVMIVGLIADQVVDRINAKRYLLRKQGFGSLSGSVLTSLKSNALFILLFILLLPTILIPVVNIIVQLWLWMILIKRPLFYDSVAMYASREEYSQLFKRDRFKGFLITLASASLFLIPIVGVFIYVLQLLFYTNFNLQRLAALR